ncbi:MAG: O-antigen ligase family protein [Turicibacter sanguinis]|uniref:O-antigen ligase family protein n=1 Tax=Turicibacter sanguinis TaxID=154288 RepID=UPI00399426EF
MRIVIKKGDLIPKRREFSNRGEMFRFWACVFGLSFPGYHIGLNTLITTVIGSNSIDTLLAYGLLIGSIIIAILYTPESKRQKYLKWPVILFIGAVITLFLSQVLVPENAIVLNRIRRTFFQTACWGSLVIGLIDDKTKMKRAFRLIGYIIFIMLVFEPFASRSTLFIEANNSWGTSGYLTWGYRMLVAAVLLLYSAFETKKKNDILFSIIASIELMLIGNRGSIVAIIVFILMYVFFCMKPRKKIKYLALFSGITIIGLMILQESNLLYLEEYLASVGVKSRNLTKILNDSITDSGRDAGYNIAINYIKSGNYFGLGVGGDHRLVGNYPHNIVLELMLQYGNFMGIILFTWLVRQSIICLVRCKDKEWNAIFVTCFCLAIVKLWFSSTYWYELWFWAYIMLIINTRKKFT